MLLRISLLPSLLLTLFISSVFSAPTGLLTEVQRYTGNGKTSGRYLVTLKQGASRPNILRQLNVAGNLPIQIVYEWDTVCNGFAAHLNPVSLALLQALPDVESIEEDGVVQTMATVTQTDAPWGLGRLSSQKKLDSSRSTFEYTYDDSAGAGVDIYIIDTGVHTEHVDFGGRAYWAKKPVFGNYKQRDGHGHGTHVAATAAGTKYGVAKKANIYAIKVLSDTGSGTVGDIVSAMDFVAKESRTSGKPTVVNMSLGGARSDAMDAATAGLVAAGVHVAVAAGNESEDADNHSPARVPTAITVGASTISDSMASFSNYGKGVDLFAPGENILSAKSGYSPLISLPSPLPPLSPYPPLKPSTDVRLSPPLSAHFFSSSNGSLD
ncbi:hypothetical protein EST38_g12201 [Candolleomyces aberdarensis]|uniref:Peptidase S8/S53 domain-containing protein n=1 Tax=Candolleomyces aberdarensis TaxID=2316362 RepID=A0A4V1Q230_9AGAR|nr:hypothetical protein EST38_g12201 [Candolleomyces aberdarensis]